MNNFKPPLELDRLTLFHPKTAHDGNPNVNYCLASYPKQRQVSTFPFFPYIYPSQILMLDVQHNFISFAAFSSWYSFLSITTWYKYWPVVSV